jgi:predicted ATPase/two-component sensor histidine kinase/tRNA A-37 threonylcarbamoyl transferase component Bud32
VRHEDRNVGSTVFGATSDYNILEKIAESKKALVYKALHKDHQDRLLVLKIFKGAYLSDRKQSRIRQKIEHLKVLSSPLAITPDVFEVREGLCFIVQPYFDGVTLDKLTEPGDVMALADFFTIVGSLALVLDAVHTAGLIHGGVKPHNILVSPDTLEVRLTDFISALDASDSSHFIYEPYFVHQTLPYTSPEQTGRISHRVTFASDLYSLGVIMYELLTGCLPFSSSDPLELIHAHLAREAPEVRELNASIPRSLSTIVAKLLLKEPERRYQSSHGLLTDLLHCRDEFAATGTVGDFFLDSDILTHRVPFVSRLVGREMQAAEILESYEHVARGNFRSLFISGLPGIGKTRLIQELQKPIVKHRGYFTSGKFDLYQKNIPYNSLIQAFRNLTRTFLTESDERVSVWRNKIQNAVGENGKVLTEVIPELEILIGTQPAVKPLPPVESLNRFHDLFDSFLTCLASEQNPLTLFIDDLQWCDTASFDFLAYVFANFSKHPYLFLLGAYRHNEVDAGHPLTRLIANIGKGGGLLSEIRLEALSPGHCHEMVASILASSLTQTRALSDFITTFTGGNPLFIHESLTYLHNENLLTLDKDEQWRWDLNKIQDSHMPTTLVSLFERKIRKLPQELITLLEYGACMGNTFLPAELSMVRDLSLVEIFTRLQPALQQGLLTENEGRLRFIHDRVQEAALSAIEPQRRRRIHWQIGKRLLTSARKQGLGLENIEKLENLFVITSHLNLGREESPDAETAYLLSDLNYHAGNKALDSLATEAANEYFKLSRQLLPEDCWQEIHYERTFKIFQKAAKTELMCGRHENSERLLNQLLDHAKTDLDRAECLAEQTISLSSIGSFVKAIETANRGLAYFGKAVPESPEEADRQRKLLMARISAREDIWQTILDMPLTEDRQSRIEFAFYSELIPDYYLCGRLPQLYLTGAQATLRCLSTGMDEAVIYSLAAIGLHLAEEEEFEQAFKYEDLVRELAAKYSNTFGAARGMNAIVWALMHSRSHPQEIADYCLKSIQCGKNCGDLFTAAVAYGPLLWNLQIQGADLRVIQGYAEECLEFSERYHLPFSAGLARATQAGWLDPMEKAGTLPSMTDTITEWEQSNHIASVGSYHVHRAISHYYLGEHAEAERHLEGALQYLTGLTDSVLKRQWLVFRILNVIKRYEEENVSSGISGVSTLQDLLQPQIRKVEQWTSLGPLLKPYLAFIYAELERVTGDFRNARSLFLDAIATAGEQNYVLLEGHLNECLGQLLNKAGQRSARVYFTEAARLYRKCHAERKYAGIMEKYPDFIEQENNLQLQAEGDSSPLYTLPNLDINYLMKSSLAISAEIEQEALLEKIMQAVIESSGAQHGFLLVTDDNDALFVRAECHAAEQQKVVMQHLELEEAEEIGKAIVRYVYRTGEKIILQDAAREDIFKDNPEVHELQLRSVLCLPVIKQSRLIGVLYLENRLASGVFSAERTQMTELLTSQAAISMEHATLLGKQREAEGQIRKSLREKEVLLKEIHHRVKNNLQIIHSMLNLQMPHFKDARAIELFKESQNRVYTMALIHEKLYQSKSLAGIDLTEYLNSLIAWLFLSYGAAEGAVSAKVSIQDVDLDLDKVIPVALIINELVSNALKHGFPDVAARHDKGVIHVDLHSEPDRGVRLSVCDNGAGFPETFDIEQSQSLGLKLVRVLTTQLNGDMMLYTKGKTDFVITFTA